MKRDAWMVKITNAVARAVRKLTMPMPCSSWAPPGDLSNRGSRVPGSILVGHSAPGTGEMSMILALVPVLADGVSYVVFDRVMQDSVRC